MNFIGIDIGSTTIKAGVLGLDEGTVAGVRSLPFPSPLARLPAGQFEIDPDAVVDVAGRLLDEMLMLVERRQALSSVARWAASC